MATIIPAYRDHCRWDELRVPLSKIALGVNVYLRGGHQGPPAPESGFRHDQAVPEPQSDIVEKFCRYAEASGKRIMPYDLDRPFVGGRPKGQ